jgi:hypothetical protein
MSTNENPNGIGNDLQTENVAEMYRNMFRFHGSQPRGLDFYPKSEIFEGRFGRMFRTLRAAHFSRKDLEALAAAMVAEHEAEPTSEDDIDDEENQGIDAGYTYLGQFIDHDITFDPASSLQKQNDPDALVDFRTPRFDLDSVYGRGPDDQPYLYADDGVHLLLGRELTGVPDDKDTHDLPRNNPSGGGRRRALIGDPRNDENVIVSQLQGTMLRFHNNMVDWLKRQNRPSLNDAKKLFEAAQRLVRRHYQWVLVNDFLPTIAGPDVVDEVLPHLRKGTSILVDQPKLKFFKWKKEPFMPIEFSAAAYRFGHSMVRPIYRLNTELADRQEIFSPDENKSLTGFREFPSNWAIDWRLFFGDLRSNPPNEGKDRIQKSYKIDTSLVNPLGNLPGVIGGSVPSLAERNLVRGLRMGLPSGQAVARYMNLAVIPDSQLRVGKATEDDTEKNPLLTDISANFKDNAPLWYYILAEAQQGFKKNDTPITLGPVGGRIVTEVFVGLLLGDNHSILHRPGWKPIEDITTKNGFAIAELIRGAADPGW